MISASDRGATSISDRQKPEHRDGFHSDHIRRLSLDLEDLHFENDRLKSELRQAQVEILALTERNTVLQHRLERLLRLVPRGSRQLIRWARRWLGRR